MLLALLSGINTESQTMASMAIAELASGANGKNRRRTQDAIAKAGGIGPLLQLVESRYPLCVAEAVNAIAQVSRNNRANQEVIAQMGGIHPLVQLLQATREGTYEGDSNPDFVQANAALALNCVCRGNAANQSAVSDLGGLPRLGILCRPSASSSTAATAGSEGRRLSYEEMGKDKQKLPEKDFPIAFVAAEAAGALWALSEGACVCFGRPRNASSGFGWLQIAISAVVCLSIGPDRHLTPTRPHRRSSVRRRSRGQ